MRLVLLVKIVVKLIKIVVQLCSNTELEEGEL